MVACMRKSPVKYSIHPQQDLLTVRFIHSWLIIFEEHLIKAKISPFNPELEECFDILEIADILLHTFCPPVQSICLNRNNSRLFLMKHL